MPVAASINKLAAGARSRRQKYLRAEHQEVIKYRGRTRHGNLTCDVLEFTHTAGENKQRSTLPI